MPNKINILDGEVVVSLKYFSNFWRFLDSPLIYCEIEHDLSWLKECIIFEISIKPAIAGNPRSNPPVPAVIER